MKNTDDCHTDILKQIEQANEELALLLEASKENSEPQPYQKLSALATQRAELIEQYLQIIPTDRKTAFIHNEIEINQRLTQLAQNLLHSAKDEVVTFLRSKNAIKKYK